MAERDVTHGGAGLLELCNWLLETTGAQPAQIAVAIETPRGPVVEVLLERGFAVFAINPKQLDRFRDRFTVAGAKDDSRDAQVLGHSLRTDRQAFRRLAVDDPLVIELREWSRMHDELKQEQSRLANRVRDQLWRYYPQAGEVTDDLGGRLVPRSVGEGADPGAGGASEREDGRAHPQDPPHSPHRRSRGAAHPAPAAAARRARHRRGRERAHPHRRRTPAAGQSADQGSRAPVGRALRRDRGRRGDRAGADLRAARRRDPAFLSRARKDQHRHAARRGLRASAATRLPRVAGVVGAGSGDPPQRQELHRAAAICLQQRLQNALYHWSRVAIQHDPISRATLRRTCAAAATAMVGRCAVSAIGCSMSCARCLNGRRSSISITRAHRRRPQHDRPSLCSTARPFLRPDLPPGRSAARRRCPGCRLRHRRSRREASWTAASTALPWRRRDQLHRGVSAPRFRVDKR